MVTTKNTNGGTVPSAFLHKQLDITSHKVCSTWNINVPILPVSIWSGRAEELNPVTLAEATVPVSGVNARCVGQLFRMRGSRRMAALMTGRFFYSPAPGACHRKGVCIGGERPRCHAAKPTPDSWAGPFVVGAFPAAGASGATPAVGSKNSTTSAFLGWVSCNPAQGGGVTRSRAEYGQRIIANERKNEVGESEIGELSLETWGRTHRAQR